MVMKAVISRENLPLFKEILRRLKDVRDEVLIYFYPNKLVFGHTSMDKASGIAVEIHKSFFVEDSWVNDYESIISVNISSKILERAVAQYKQVGFSFEGTIKLYSEESKLKLVLPCLQPDDFDPTKIINMSWSNVITLPNELVGDAVKALGVDNISSSQDMKISLADYVLKFSRNTDYVDVDKSIVTECDGEATVDINYTDFSKMIVSLARLAEEVRLDIESTKPIGIKYLFPVGIKVAYALAPQSPAFDDEEEEEVDEVNWDDNPHDEEE